MRKSIMSTNMMSKRILAVILPLFLVVVFITGCGSIAKQDQDPDLAKSEEAVGDRQGFSGSANNSVVNSQFSDSSDAEVVSEKSAGNQDNITSTGKDESVADSIIGNGMPISGSANAILEQRKIIRSANVSIEVENFDEAYGKINSFILGIGFVQESNISSEKVYVVDEKKYKPVKRGTIVIRVDRQKFDKVLSNIKGIGEILNESMGTDDVTDRFFDTESQLRLLRYEQERLENYLKKTEDIDKILKTESRLTEIRHEIESLTGTLKKLNDLVELSTITINMNEKSPIAQEPQKPKTYLERLGWNIAESARGTLQFCGELLIFLIRALPTLILLTILCFVAIAVYRKYLRKRNTSSNKKDDIKPM